MHPAAERSRTAKPGIAVERLNGGGLSLALGPKSRLGTPQNRNNFGVGRDATRGQHLTRGQHFRYQLRL